MKADCAMHHWSFSMQHNITWFVTGNDVIRYCTPVSSNNSCI